MSGFHLNNLIFWRVVSHVLLAAVVGASSSSAALQVLMQATTTVQTRACVSVHNMHTTLHLADPVHVSVPHTLHNMERGEQLRVVVL